MAESPFAGWGWMPRDEGEPEVGWDWDWERTHPRLKAWRDRGPGLEERPFRTFKDTRPEMRDMWQSGMGRAQGWSEGAGGRYLDSRGNMQKGLGFYEELMNDPSKSVAQQQLRSGMEANLANQIRAQSAARGGNMAGAQQLASGQAAGLGAEMNQQAAQLRAQEYAGAVQGYSGLAGQMAGLDLQQQTSMGQLGLGYGQLGTDWELGIREQMEQEKENRWQRGMGLFDKVAGAKEGLLAAIGKSDVRVKQNITPYGANRGVEEDPLVAYERDRMPASTLTAEEEDRIDSTWIPASTLTAAEAAMGLGKVPTYEYEYRPGYGLPPGRRMGIMAQDLQKQPGLSGLVVQTPQGLGTDTAGMASTAVAASADQERRIQDLENNQKRIRELEEQLAASKKKR